MHIALFHARRCAVQHTLGRLEHTSNVEAVDYDSKRLRDVVWEETNSICNQREEEVHIRRVVTAVSDPPQHIMPHDYYHRTVRLTVEYDKVYVAYSIGCDGFEMCPVNPEHAAKTALDAVRSMHIYSGTIRVTYDVVDKKNTPESAELVQKLKTELGENRTWTVTRNQ